MGVEYQLLVVGCLLWMVGVDFGVIVWLVCQEGQWCVGDGIGDDVFFGWEVLVDVCLGWCECEEQVEQQGGFVK